MEITLLASWKTRSQHFQCQIARNLQAIERFVFVNTVIGTNRNESVNVANFEKQAHPFCRRRLELDRKRVQNINYMVLFCQQLELGDKKAHNLPK